MNQPMTRFERMVDQVGRQLTWRGRWIPVWHVIDERAPNIVDMPVRFPRRYYKVDR